jgi:WD40 repeat protein
VQVESGTGNGGTAALKPRVVDPTQPLVRLSTPVKQLLFFPDGRRLLVAGQDTIETLNLDRDSAPQPLLGGKERPITYGGIALTRDGKRLLTGGTLLDTTPEGIRPRDCDIHVWDADTGEQLARWSGHTRPVACIAVSPDGQRAFSGGGSVERLSDGAIQPVDCGLRLWDIASGRTLRTFEGHIDGVACVAISPDGRWAVSGGADGAVRVWDVGAGTELSVLRQHRATVQSVAISNDGRRIVSGAADGSVIYWDIGHGNPPRRLQAKGRAQFVHRVAFANDGRHALSAHGRITVQGGESTAEDCVVRIWDLAAGEEKAHVKGHTNPVTALAVPPSDGWFLTGSHDGTVRLWELAE